ncbi:lipoprotein [Robertkochia aurantiaca]|uniref:lipoprotein n=1 Tax=Robertkochia aurantiaca TaxID=2873700 RepID=UPI001CCC2A3F|nr:lipoprotein [Robertkochia sp. 3YJGBD-33]
MKKYFLALLGVITLSACSNDDAPQDATLQITAGLTETTAAKSLASKGPENLKFDTGYVWLIEVVFDGTFSSGEAISKTVAVDSKIDFATGVASPDMADITIPAGEYQDVNLGLELRDEDDQPSVVMEGTYTRADATVVPVRFEFNSGEVFEAETDQTVIVAEEQKVTSKIVFDPDVWFSVVTNEMMENASANSEGIIVISGSSNAAIFDLVADRLDVSTQSVFE